MALVFFHSIFKDRADESALEPCMKRKQWSNAFWTKEIGIHSSNVPGDFVYLLFFDSGGMSLMTLMSVRYVWRNIISRLNNIILRWYERRSFGDQKTNSDSNQSVRFLEISMERTFIFDFSPYKSHIMSSTLNLPTKKKHYSSTHYSYEDEQQKSTSVRQKLFNRRGAFYIVSKVHDIFESELT